MPDVKPQRSDFEPLTELLSEPTDHKWRFGTSATSSAKSSAQATDFLGHKVRKYEVSLVLSVNELLTD